MAEKDLTVIEIDRRKFLKLASLGGASLTAYLLLPQLKSLLNPPEISPLSPEVVKNINLKLNNEALYPPHIFAWVCSKSVEINTLIAQQKLNEKIFEKNKKYSLFEILELKEASKNPDNLDPKRGWVAGLGNSGEWSLRTPYKIIDLIRTEAAGICLITTFVFRTLATAPVKIIDSSTHFTLDELIQRYFSPKYHLQSHPLFSKPGTDAMIFFTRKEGVICDLIFEPLISMKFKIFVCDSSGNPISLSTTPLSIEEILTPQKNSSTLILAASLFSLEDKSPFETTLSLKEENHRIALQQKITDQNGREIYSYQRYSQYRV